jgi:hypothetical protein
MSLLRSMAVLINPMCMTKFGQLDHLAVLSLAINVITARRLEPSRGTSLIYGMRGVMS